MLPRDPQGEGIRPLAVRSGLQMLMCGKVTQQQRPITATTIPKNYFYFSIDFNFIYAILNIVKVNKKGELICR